jgi:hypothetical protein
MKQKASEASILLWEQLKDLHIGFIEKEKKFWYARKWAFDFSLIMHRMALGIEIEGGAWTQGRHTRGKGFIADMEKYNHAALLGWRVLRFTPQQVLKGEAIAFIRRVLDA